MINKIKENPVIAAMIAVVFFGAFVLYLCAKYVGSSPKSQYIISSVEDAKEREYTAKASKLVDYYYRQNVPVRFQVVKETLQAVDYYLPHYFPDGPFNSRDFIAMAMVESSFQQYLVGTSGEKGIFQIMESSSKYMGVTKNQFDIETNTELAMFVLSEKFKEYPDYRKAIIAYNGVIVNETTKKWNDKYWKAFSKAKIDVDIMFKAIK